MRLSFADESAGQDSRDDMLLSTLYRFCVIEGGSATMVPTLDRLSPPKDVHLECVDGLAMTGSLGGLCRNVNNLSVWRANARRLTVTDGSFYDVSSCTIYKAKSIPRANKDLQRSHRRSLQSHRQTGDLNLRCLVL